MDWQRLLVEAARCGIAIPEFWDLTPRETFLAIDAAGWRTEQAARRDVALAWHVAALSRTKTLPSLARLLKPPKARVLEGEELEKRRTEHAAMVDALGDPGTLRTRRRTDGT
jgi:hypothetical protein